MTADRQLVLVVDDEPSICWAFERMLEDLGHEVVTASSAESGLELARRRRPNLTVLDVRLPGEDGITALPKFIEASGGAPVVVMTAFGDLETAVAAVQRGASEYLVKPFRLDDARRVCQNALRVSAVTMTKTPTPEADFQQRIVGQSPAIGQAFRQIALVAASDLSVLITGETGTGKELVAEAIHRHSRRAGGPYFPVAPVAMNPDLIESELFGHAKGAFTGASRDHAGLFEQAEGGTVLLDEIGDLPMTVQVKLLRVLEQGQYARVGEVEPRRCDVRILAATNCDLHEAVREGRFRQDLFYRLNGLHIHLPPLRQRSEDIRPLCEYFLQRLGYDQPAEKLNDALLEDLARRPWYGNVRELRNAVEHAAVIARGRELLRDDFPPPQPGRDSDAPAASDRLPDGVRAWATEHLDPDQDVTDLHTRLLAVVEPPLLAETLRHTGGNRAKAAELLGMHRGTLREKLRQYGMDPSKEKGSGAARLGS